VDRYDLDHVALAAPDTSEMLRCLTGRLGGRVIFGGQAIGFRPMQVWIGDDAGDGMSIELLEPWLVERNDFLARFLARHGSGPHHLTFKVPDLMAALDRLRGSGYQPVNIDVSDPEWKEAFLLPRQAHGTVVQLAESDRSFGTRAELLAHVRAHGPNEHPRWWVDPEPAEGPPAKLRQVVLRTPRLSSALGFFGGMLQGEIACEDGESAELVWPTGSRLRLEARPDAAPGVDRLEVEGLAAPLTLIGTRLAPVPDR
jgi:catechol 2,3-dioxygenase-like lactoylglutathione lyase family enzyme